MGISSGSPGTVLPIFDPEAGKIDWRGRRRSKRKRRRRKRRRKKRRSLLRLQYMFLSDNEEEDLENTKISDA